MLSTPIDIYCERTDIGFWNEPANAATNLSFLLAAWCLYQLYTQKNLGDWQLAALIALVAVVGFGSFLFHTFATELTMWADVIPIGAFVFFYLYVTLRRLLRLSRAATFGALLGFILVAAAMSHLPISLNGSEAYLPCLLAIIVIGAKLKNNEFFKAAGVFTASLTFRTLDMAACGALPLGTHFLWHLLNGLVLYLLVRALVNALK